jgi:prepilin-type N-terminal cleavage/methylation domain-containing protein
VLQHLKDRRQDETGFTLIELMVVVLIMGILMAIAIPTFLSTQGSANDASAKSNATNAFTGEKAYFEDNISYIDATSTQNGVTLDNGLPWSAAGNVTTKGQVASQAANGATYVNGGVFKEIAATPWTGPALLIEALSKSNNCFYIADDESLASGTPVLAYAESAGGCFTDANITLPATSPLASAGNAGAHIVASGGTLTAAAGWYASW